MSSFQFLISGLHPRTYRKWLDGNIFQLRRMINIAAWVLAFQECVLDRWLRKKHPTMELDNLLSLGVIFRSMEGGYGIIGTSRGIRGNLLFLTTFNAQLYRVIAIFCFFFFIVYTAQSFTSF